MATLKEEQEQLKSKIVESPEELKNYKELMKETVKKLKKSKVRVPAVCLGGVLFEKAQVCYQLELLLERLVLLVENQQISG